MVEGGEEGVCWTWSGGRSCGASTSCAASRSSSWRGRRGRAATRSGRRCGLSRRRDTTAGGRARRWTRSNEIHVLLRRDYEMPGQRIRELIAPLGYAGGKTIVDDYLREVRPLFAPPPRTFQRTIYRPGEICQFDLWQPRAEVPVGHGQTRLGWAVIACLGYSRAGAGVLVFSRKTEGLLAG